jgi:hypothetical protein
MTSEQRSSAENGIWLCQNCAHLVDTDVTSFPKSVLLSWKSKAEEYARSAVDGSAADSGQANIEVTLVYVEDTIQSKRHDYTLKVCAENTGEEIVDGFCIEVEFPSLVVDRPEELEHYVSAKSADDSAVFRVPIEGSSPLYPGEVVVVFELKYFVDSKIYWDHDQVFEKNVTAAIRLVDGRVSLISKRFGELQVF